jgi:hypothetical protein
VRNTLTDIPSGLREETALSRPLAAACSSLPDHRQRCNFLPKQPSSLTPVAR